MLNVLLSIITECQQLCVIRHMAIKIEILIEACDDSKYSQDT